MKYWYDKWDGTEFSLIKHSGGDRRSILTTEEKKKHIYDFTSKKAKVEAPTYLEVKAMLKRKQGRDPLLQQLKETVNHSELPPRSEKESQKAKVCNFEFSPFSLFSLYADFHVICVL